MKANRIVFFLLILAIANITMAQDKKYLIRTVAFYNFENLFDTINDANTYDEDWTPLGKEKWNSEKYNQKLDNLARVLSQIGTAENQDSPIIIGCCEIENRSVLEDLVKNNLLSKKNYGIIHFDSPDRRGIDVALLYQKRVFQPMSYAKIPLYIYTKSTNTKKEKQKPDDDIYDSTAVETNKLYRIYTRDQLIVTGFLDGEEISIIVNHWPSRMGGEKRSRQFRIEAANLSRKLIDSLQNINPKSKIMMMGDFNDGPTDESIKTLGTTKFNQYNNSAKSETGDNSDIQNNVSPDTLLQNKNNISTKKLYNPFEIMFERGIGTLAYRDVWNIFDQIILSQSLLSSNNDSLTYWKAGIFNKPFLTQKSGRFKGYPLRHSASVVGFSDHFPVYVYLVKKIN